MKITKARAILLQAPTPGLSWIGGPLETWDVALVELTTDEGITGLGEVTQGAFGAVSVPGIVEAMAPFVVGEDPTSPRRFRERLYNRTLFWARGGITAGVVSALEIAAWDIAGKVAGLPVHRMLGGGRDETRRVYASAGLGSSVDEVVTNFKEQKEAGYSLIKVRALRDAPSTMDLLDALADHCTGDTRLLLDGVQGSTGKSWSLNDAITIGRRLSDLNALLFEEPFRAEDVENYARLRRAVEVPLAGAETYTSAAEFRRIIDADGLDVLQPDATIVGGIGELHRVAELGRSRGLVTIPHTWGSAVTVAANWSAAFAFPDLEIVEFNTYENPLISDLFVEAPRIIDGVASAPTAPGLGVQLTAETEEQFGSYVAGRGIFVA